VNDSDSLFDAAQVHGAEFVVVKRASAIVVNRYARQADACQTEIGLLPSEMPRFDKYLKEDNCFLDRLAI
jgi:hypothetical protein